MSADPPVSALQSPVTDPTPIFEQFRGCYATELLTVAVKHFGLFSKFTDGPLSFSHLQKKLGLADRPAVVLITAIRAMGLLAMDEDGRLSPTTMAREHLSPDGYFSVSDYVGLMADSPGVTHMAELLRNNAPTPAGDEDDGAAFIYRDGIESAMDQQATARHLTLALCGRAKNVAPSLAEHFPVTEGTMVDVGGGTGIYAIACVQRHPKLHAIVMDRPEVLKVAAEFCEQYGVSDRVELLPGDMFETAMPKADAVLLSNILHDWNVPENQRLIQRCADALKPDGQLVIHDVFLNDAMDGPLPIALYSAALFSITEGRAYSAREYRSWMEACDLEVSPVVPTLVHCGMLAGGRASP